MTHNLSIPFSGSMQTIIRDGQSEMNEPEAVVDMKHLHLDSIYNSLPYDISLKIVSCLAVREVCALGSCSKFWKELCGSDPIWASLCKVRWPSLNLSDDDRPYTDHNDSAASDSGDGSVDWRSFYIHRHFEMAERARMVVNNVELRAFSYSLEVRDYLEAIQELSSIHFGFKDVQLFLFKPELKAFLNMVGVHYSISWLGVPSEYVVEALKNNKISEREVCVKWWKVGRWLYGFRLRDESHSRSVTLADFAMPKEKELLEVLQRGAVYEVIRVQITNAISPSVPWTLSGSRPSSHSYEAHYQLAR